MKGVMTRVPEELLAHRRKTGEDRWDEVWEGVLHMTPAPSAEHQRILTRLLVFLVPILEDRGRGLMRPGINVCDAPEGWENYRIPDLTFIAAGRETILAPDGIRFGGPDAVIEIRSPDDETYEKLTFFATLGVREVIVIDRDSKQVELFTLEGTHYARALAAADGSVMSSVLGITLRTLPQTPPTLLVQDSGDASLVTEI
jgi:Uma2 family endonuclease